MICSVTVGFGVGFVSLTGFDGCFDLSFCAVVGFVLIGVFIVFGATTEDFGVGVAFALIGDFFLTGVGVVFGVVFDCALAGSPKNPAAEKQTATIKMMTFRYGFFIFLFYESSLVFNA